ncbi:MAG: hypothetical protein ABEH43_05415 [Flavobacteriales bacterium]
MNIKVKAIVTFGLFVMITGCVQQSAPRTSRSYTTRTNPSQNYQATQIQLHVSKGSVYVDGNLEATVEGVTDWASFTEAKKTFLQVPPGKHRIYIKDVAVGPTPLKGSIPDDLHGGPYEFEVKLKEGESASIYVDLALSKTDYLGPHHHGKNYTREITISDIKKIWKRIGRDYRIYRNYVRSKDQVCVSRYASGNCSEWEVKEGDRTYVFIGFSGFQSIRKTRGSIDLWEREE